jgi:hypothetical protein
LGAQNKVKGVKRRNEQKEEKKRKKNKRNENWAFDLFKAQPNFFWASKLQGPGSCWAQYPAHPRPKPNLLWTPESPSLHQIHGESDQILRQIT